MPDNSLQKFLDEQILTVEEKAMWLDAGFYLGVYCIHSNTGPNEWRPIVRVADGFNMIITDGLFKSLRKVTIERWERTKKSSEVIRVLEIDSVRDSLEARNDD